MTDTETLRRTGLKAHAVRPSDDPGASSQLLTGSAMAGFVVAHFFGRRARIMRLLIAGLYFAGVSAFIIYALL